MNSRKEGEAEDLFPARDPDLCANFEVYLTARNTSTEGPQLRIAR